MDITPLIPRGRKIISGYGDGGFTISGERLEGSVLLFPDEVLSWNVRSFEALSQKSFTALIERKEQLEVLLLGSGKMLQFLSEELHMLLRSHHIAVDVMDTGAACRTYNILLSEERKVAAALIAV